MVVVVAPVPVAGVGSIARCARLGIAADEPLKEISIIHEVLHWQGVIGDKGVPLVFEEVGEGVSQRLRDRRRPLDR